MGYNYNDKRVQSLKYWCIKVLYLPVHNKKINIEHISKMCKQQINDYVWRWFISNENNADMIIQYAHNNSVEINDEEFWKKQIQDFCNPRTYDEHIEYYQNISDNPIQLYSTIDKLVFNFNFFEKIVKVVLEPTKKYVYNGPFFFFHLEIFFNDDPDVSEEYGKYVDKIYRYGKWQIEEID